MAGPPEGYSDPQRRARVAAVAGSVEYDLHSLGWYAFQQLCLSITREVLGQTVASFLESNDGGRDGAFEGTWSSPSTGDVSGPFVIQCKFTGNPRHRLSLSDIAGELGKVKQLVRRGKCTSYILMTNARVSGTSEEQLNTAFKREGVRHFSCLSYSWICQVIRDHKRIRLLVPRVYGLGDLSQILDERAYDQASALLASLQDDLAKIVLTKTYDQAARMLEEHGFVLLLGEPAAGKSTIAAMLAMAAVDQWRCLTAKLEKPARLVDHWNPHEPSQFFWIDDAFGTTQYEPQLARGWNHIFSHVKAALKSGTKVVMTSRDYIYNSARHDLKQDAFPMLRESQVVIDVHELLLQEKRQILYNHLKLGTQPRAWRARIKPYLEDVAENPQFIPEIARRLSNPIFTKDLIICQGGILDFVERPRDFLRDVLLGLDVHSKAALALIYMAAGNLRSPITLSESEASALVRLGSDLAHSRTALNSLRDSLVRYLTLNGQGTWTFKHPTIADAFAALVLDDPELLSIYLYGVPMDQLVQQVTCGDVQFQGAVVVPRDLFSVVLSRLTVFSDTWENQRQADYFLAYRCHPSFLKLFLAYSPDIYDRLADPGLYLSAVSEVSLAIRLFETHLLPERYRRAFVEKIIAYAVEGTDTYVFDNDRLRRMLTKEENSRLRRKICRQLIPRLDDVRRAREREYRSDGPEEHMSMFLSTLETLRKEFRRTSHVGEYVDRVERQVQEWIQEHTIERQAIPPRSGLVADEGLLPTSDGNRSIFDDVDT